MADRNRRTDDDRYGRTTRAFGRDDDWNDAERERAGWPRDDRSYRRPQGDDGAYGGNVGFGFGGAGERQGAGRGAAPTRREMGRQYGPSYPGEGRDYSDGRAGYGMGRANQGHDDDRGFLDKAGDEIASWFGDDDAERRRWADKHRGHGPKGYVRSSERIHEDVCDRLSDDPMVDARDIEVEVSGTEVTLSGTVPTRDQRRRAEAVADGVPGVGHVQNNTRVADPATAGSQSAATAKARVAATNR